MKNIVILDEATLLMDDLDWVNLSQLGNVTRYVQTSVSEVVERAKNAHILIVNKVVIDAAIIAQLPNLQCICVSATGVNNVDLAAAKARNIRVCNVAGYAADGAAQHVFALLLTLAAGVRKHHESVVAGQWSAAANFCYTVQSMSLLKGKTLGILGFGQIGQQVAKLALAFGMTVIATHRHPERDALEGVTFVEWETLVKESDVLSLHAPLNDSTAGIINKNSLAQMKKTAWLINTARGGLVVEADLKTALENEEIVAAAIDVISEEPPRNGNSLIGVKNCLVTPHIAWAYRETRELLRDEVVENVAAFLSGEERNMVI
ncbi:MAG: D-2-hydroxyacid dehydrogenase [Saprospiraceae bacterium]